MISSKNIIGHARLLKVSLVTDTLVGNLRHTICFRIAGIHVSDVSKANIEDFKTSVEVFYGFGSKYISAFRY